MNEAKNMNISRRVLLSSVSGVVAMASLPAFALSTNNGQAFVEKAVGDLEGIMNSGKSGGALQSAVGGFFRKYADVPTIARAVLGAPWRGMDGGQRNAYVAAFEGYAVRKYSSSFKSFSGGKAQIVNVRDGGKAGVLVDVDFVKAGQSPSKLQVQVSDGGGSAKILDMKVEGVSMIGTEREQVRSLLAQNGGDVNKLIAALS